MRWFFGGVIIGLLILELKVLGGCGYMRAVSQTAGAGSSADAAGGLGAGLAAGSIAGSGAGHKCSCAGAVTAVTEQSVAPAQAKLVLGSPSQFGNAVEPSPTFGPNTFGINSSFPVF